MYEPKKEYSYKQESIEEYKPLPATTVKTSTFVPRKEYVSSYETTTYEPKKYEPYVKATSEIYTKYVTKKVEPTY